VLRPHREDRHGSARTPRRQLAHRLRSEHQAVLVGVGTVIGPVRDPGEAHAAASLCRSGALLQFTAGLTGRTLSSTAGNIITVSGNPGGFADVTLKRPLFASTGMTTTRICNPWACANSKSRSSCAGTPITAPLPYSASP